MKKVFESVAVVGPLLVVPGYLNYYLFYSHFDIEIGSFLSTTELIFSFLPILIPLLSAAGGLAVMAGIGPLLAGRPQDILDQNMIAGVKYLLNRRAIRERIKEEFRTRRHTLFGLISMFLLVVLYLIALCFYLALILFPIFLIQTSMSIERSPLSSFQIVIIGLMWIVIVFIQVTSRDFLGDKYVLKIVAISTAVLLSFFIIKIDTKERASAILDGKPYYDALIKLNDGTMVKTTSELLFIGKTNGYIFLRDKTKDQNVIFPMASVTELHLNKASSHPGQ